jgi:acetyl-CoA acetyltransferase
MDRDFESVVRDAEQLDPHDQFLLAERLTKRLGETPEQQAAWSVEAQRRADAIDRGEMKTVDAFEALRDLRSTIESKIRNKK